MRRCSSHLQAVAVGVALLAACSDGSERAAEPQPPIPVVTAAPQHVVAAPLQSQILGDNDITLDEMEQALRAVVACVEEQGYIAELRSFDGGNGYEFFVASPTGDHQAAADALQICEARFLSEIHEPFREQHGPTPAEIEAERDLTRQCLREKGYQVGDAWPIDSHVDVWDELACDPDLTDRASVGGTEG